MRLEDIGFYTLSDERARTASATSRLVRCELILGARCNFKCPYCRHVGGPMMDESEAHRVVSLWADQGLFAIRFSGGEPTLHPSLRRLVRHARTQGVEKIAISTNGSAPLSFYDRLIMAGANDFSVSLDACCAADGDIMAGVSGRWQAVVEAIRFLSARTYTTVGVVLTGQNQESCERIVNFALGLGVSDVRLIPAAQNGKHLPALNALGTKPILAYRLKHIKDGVPVRGLGPSDSRRCWLALDDMVVSEGKHFPCVIAAREGAEAIGLVGPEMRAERELWVRGFDTHASPICRDNCLDVCRDYNNFAERFHA